MSVAYVPVSSLGSGALFLISLFLFLAGFTIGLRVWALRIVNRAARLHDYLIFFALFLSCGHVVVIYLAIMVGGMGHHIVDVPPTAIITLLKLFFAANLTWLFSTSIVKASVLCLYLDLFQVHKTFQRLVHCFLAFIVVFFVAFFISVLTICRPVSHLWNPLGPGSCGNSTQSQIATSSINTIVDLAIVLLPIPILAKLQMSKQKRIRIIAIFGVGAIICMINIARLVTTIVLSQVDLTYNLIGPAILTCLEVEIGIINACLPTINPILTRVNHTFKHGSIITWFRSAHSTESSATRQYSDSGTTLVSQRNADRNASHYPGDHKYKGIVMTDVQSATSHQPRTYSGLANDDRDILVTRDITVQSNRSNSYEHRT